MEKRVLKVGVVGMNRGRGVIAHMLEEDNAKLCAICDKNPELLEKSVKFFEDRGVKDLQAFTSYDEFLKADIDTVYLATDATLHAPQAIQALNSGKHVISEIPAVDTVEEARALKAAVLAHPELKYMGGENCCFWQFIQDWKEMYENGKFGQAVYAEGEYIHTGDPKEFEPINTWRKSYNAIQYITHDLGPLMYILGDRCVSVTCMEPDIRYNPYKTGKENGVALFKTAKGAVIKILICFGAYTGDRGSRHNFLLYGTEGSIEKDRRQAPYAEEASYAHFSDMARGFQNCIQMPAPFGKKNVGGHGGADFEMMRAFFKCILEDTAPPLDIDLTIQMSIAGIYAHESAMQGGKPIEIPEI